MLTRKRNVLAKEMAAETAPSESAVNREEAKIFAPMNQNAAA